MCFGTTLICSACHRRQVHYTRQCDNDQIHPIYGGTYRMSFQRCHHCNSESSETQGEHEQFQRYIDRAKRLMEYLRGELSTPYTPAEIFDQARYALEGYLEHEALHPYRVQSDWRDFMIVAESETTIDAELRTDLEECLRRQRDIFFIPGRRVVEEDVYYRYSNVVNRFRTRLENSFQGNRGLTSPQIPEQIEVSCEPATPVAQTNVEPLTFLQWATTNGQTEGSDEFNLRVDVQSYTDYLHNFPNENVERLANLLRAFEQEETQYDFVPVSAGSSTLHSFRAWCEERGHESPHDIQEGYRSYLHQQREEEQALIFWNERQIIARNYRRFLNFHSGGQWEGLELVTVRLGITLADLEYQPYNPEVEDEIEGEESSFEVEEEEERAMTFAEWIEFDHPTVPSHANCILTEEEILRDEVHAYANNYLAMVSSPRQLEEFRELRRQIEADRVHFDFDPTKIDHDINLMSFREFLEYESAEVLDSNDWEMCLTTYQLHLDVEAPSPIARGFAAARHELCQANRREFEGLLQETSFTEQQQPDWSTTSLVPGFTYATISEADINDLRVQAREHHLRNNIDMILDSIMRQRDNFGVRLNPEWTSSEVDRVRRLLQLDSQTRQQASDEDIERRMGGFNTGAPIPDSTEPDFEQLLTPSMNSYSLHHPRRTNLSNQVRLEPCSNPYMFQAGNIRPQWPDLDDINRMEIIDQIDNLAHQLEYATQLYAIAMVSQTREAHERLSALTLNNTNNWLSQNRRTPQSSYLVRRVALEEEHIQRQSNIEDMTVFGSETDEALEREDERFIEDLHALQLDELTQTRLERWDLSVVFDPESVRDMNEAHDRRLIYQETAHRQRLQHDMEELIRCYREVRSLPRFLQMRRDVLTRQRDREVLIADSIQLRRQLRLRQEMPTNIRAILGDDYSDREEDDRTTEVIEAENNTLREYQRLNPSPTSIDQDGTAPQFYRHAVSPPIAEDDCMVVEILLGMRNEGSDEGESDENEAEQQRLESLFYEANSAAQNQQRLEVVLDRSSQLANNVERNLRQIVHDQGEGTRLRRALEVATGLSEQAESVLQEARNQGQALNRSREATQMVLQDFVTHRQEEIQRRNSRAIGRDQFWLMADEENHSAHNEPESDHESDSEDNNDQLDENDGYYYYELSLLPSEDEPIPVPQYWHLQEMLPGFDPFMSREDLLNELEYERLRRQNRLTIVIELTPEQVVDPVVDVQATLIRMGEEAQLRRSNQRVTGEYDRDDFFRMVAFDHEDVASDDEY